MMAFTLMPMTSLAVEFPPSADRGAPARTAGGGIRGESCEASNVQPMTAVTPINNVSTFVGDAAMLWVYIPSGENLEAELYVQNDVTGEAVYQHIVDLPAAGGILPIVLPTKTADGETLLDVGSDYFWELAVICNAQDRNQDQFVQGFLQRVEKSDTLTAALANETDLATQAELYAAAGIWQETLQIVTQLRDDQPNLWQGLLSSVALEGVADTPMLDPISIEMLAAVN